MEEEDFLEKYLSQKILKYEQQMRGIQFHLGMAKMTLSRLQSKSAIGKTVPIKKPVQMNLFGT